ncbi:MAG: hypothetical protein MMC23_009441 [Stictis urceolatum]|nr:hypothetical protein [Stictis urceolata]
MASDQDATALQIENASLKAEVERLRRKHNDAETAILVLSQCLAAKAALLDRTKDEFLSLKLTSRFHPTAPSARLKSPTSDLLDLNSDPVPDLARDDVASIHSEAATEPLTPPRNNTPLTSFIKESNSRSFRALPATEQAPSLPPARPQLRPPRFSVESQWPNPELRAHAYDRQGRFDNADYYRHGITYTPGLTFSNTRQRVLLSNIAPSATLTDVVSRIRGGTIVCIEFFRTAHLTGSNSALVRFTKKKSALRYDDFLHMHSITLHGRRLHAELIPTDSYPLSHKQHLAVTVHAQTRCLELENFATLGVSRSVFEHDVRLVKESGFTGLEGAWLNERGGLEVRFSSVFYAGRAFGLFGLFGSHGRYRGTGVRFVPDPCAGEVEELLGMGDGGSAVTGGLGESKWARGPAVKMGDDEEVVVVDQDELPLGHLI